MRTVEDIGCNAARQVPLNPVRSVTNLFDR